jgi:hypothetical protein
MSLTFFHHAWLCATLLALVTSSGLYAQPVANATACAAEEAQSGNRNRSVLTVRWKVINGKLAVDHQASRGLFKPSLLLQCRAGMIGVSAAQAQKMTLEMEAQLLREFDALLLKLEPFVDLALPVSDPANPVTDVPPPATLRASHDWKTYRQLYTAWNDSRPPNVRSQFPLRIVMLDRVLKSSASLMLQLADTPIRAFFKDETEDDSPANDQLDDVNGQVTFHINDPIGDLLQEQDYNLKLPSVTNLENASFIAPDKNQIVAALAPLKGRFWRSSLVRNYLNDYFLASRSGYQRILGDDMIGPASALPKQIIIPPVPQIVRIVFYGIKDEGEIKAGLRQLLTDEEFALYLVKKSQPNSQIIKDCPARIDAPDPAATADSGQGISISCKYVAYEDLGAKDRLPFLNANDLLLQQRALAAMDLVMGPGKFTPDNENEEGEIDDGNVVRFVELQINQRETEPPPPPPPPPPAVTRANATAPANSANDFSGFNPRPERCVEKPCLNFIGGEIVYRPGQGIRFNGLYERKRILQGDLSIRVGNFGGYTIAGDGAWDYLFFDKLNHRLAFQVHGATDSTANRLFNRVRTDERRTGGMMRAEYELMTNPTLLTLSFGGKHETVELTQGDKIVAKQNVTSFQTGAVFVTASKDILWRRTVQLEPTLRFAPGVGAQQKSFAVFSLAGIFHQYLPGRRDFVISGRVDTASKNTPLFEQPFLGGVDSVRGFRMDDAIGRRQWTLQHEYQFPVPGVKPESTGLLAKLRSQVQLAAFFDVGGMYQTTGSAAGTRVGSGVGVRFAYGAQVLKFDWAYGIGNGAQERGRGRFYFSISREIPRLIRR